MKTIFTLVFLLVCTIAYSQEKKKQSSFKRFVKENYVNFTDLGGLFGKSYQITPNAIQSPMYSFPVEASTNFTIQTFNGLKVYKNLAVGATVGVDWFSNYQIIPISLGIRGSLGENKTKKVKPFVGIDAGYGFMWLNDNTSINQEINGGLAFSPMIGLLIPTGGNANFTFSVGYKRNVFNTKTTSGIADNPYFSENQYQLNRMAVRLGVNF
ncbi:MAG: hypothetical protein V4585_02785 [Bacteroidota bacterium]